MARRRFNRRRPRRSATSIGEKVASRLCHGGGRRPIPSRPRSINIDDEGTPTSRTTLIEKASLGLFAGQAQRRFDEDGTHRQRPARKLRAYPMPRMTNTFMLAGESAPEDILKSVRKASTRFLRGGQVDITSGKFVFSASEAYLIEDGKITKAGERRDSDRQRPDVLTRVSMVGADLKLDEGVGTAAKTGQSCRSALACRRSDRWINSRGTRA